MNLIDSNSVDFYPKIIKDYLSGELKSKNIIDWEYSQEQLASKKGKRYSSKNRSYVHKALLDQYASFDLTEKESLHIKLFSKERTYIPIFSLFQLGFITCRWLYL